jgi:phosphoribosylformylglycinamidine synthase
MRWAVIQFPGSNCDQDVLHVLKNVLAQEVEYVWHKDSSLAGADAVVLPGGFSYGDYLRCGAIARFSPIMPAVKQAAAAGKTVLGICNGFQILCESGLLPGALTRNAGLKYVCKPVHVRVENSDTPYTNACREGEVLTIPIGHMEGNYFCDQATLAELRRDHRILFRYSTPTGEVTLQANPNGSLDNIAGISNRGGNVLGMMPHPERASEMVLGGREGFKIFESLAGIMAEK